MKCNNERLDMFYSDIYVLRYCVLFVCLHLYLHDFFLLCCSFSIPFCFILLHSILFCFLSCFVFFCFVSLLFFSVLLRYFQFNQSAWLSKPTPGSYFPDGWLNSLSLLEQLVVRCRLPPLFPSPSVVVVHSLFVYLFICLLLVIEFVQSRIPVWFDFMRDCFLHL